MTVMNNMDKAWRGDPAAQHEVGKAHRCSVDEKNYTFYSTRTAVGWLCASAVKGYAPVIYEIGKIYSGDVIDGVRLARRLAQGVAGTSKNHPVVYAWPVQAEICGEKDTKSPADELWDGMSPAQQAEMRKLVDAGSTRVRERLGA